MKKTNCRGVASVAAFLVSDMLVIRKQRHKGEPRSHAADAAGKTGGSGLRISPVELEDKVRRQLQADGKALGLAGLARYSRGANNMLMHADFLHFDFVSDYSIAK